MLLGRRSGLGWKLRGLLYLRKLFSLEKNISLTIFLPKLKEESLINHYLPFRKKLTIYPNAMIKYFYTYQITLN